MNQLLSLRKQKQFTQKQVAERLGISRQAYANYETGAREPDIRTLRSLSELFGVSIDYLLAAGEDTDRGASEKGVKIPVFGKVAAGIPIEAITDIEDYEEIPARMAAGGTYVALRIRGHSMEPLISDGDTVIIRAQDDVETGDIAIVMVNGDEATCKKIQKTPEGVLLIPINPSYDPMFFTNREIEEMPLRIFGKVVELRRSF